MRAATGEPTWGPELIASMPRKAIAKVLELKAPPGGPGEAARVAWARQIAREYVDGNQGREFTTFAFCTWIGSGKYKAPQTATPPHEQPAVKLARKEREESFEEAKRHASPITPEALERLKAAGLR